MTVSKLTTIELDKLHSRISDRLGEGQALCSSPAWQSIRLLDIESWQVKKPQQYKRWGSAFWIIWIPQLLASGRRTAFLEEMQRVEGQLKECRRQFGKGDNDFNILRLKEEVRINGLNVTKDSIRNAYVNDCKLLISSMIGDNRIIRRQEKYLMPLLEGIASISKDREFEFLLHQIQDHCLWLNMDFRFYVSILTITLNQYFDANIPLVDVYTEESVTDQLENRITIEDNNEVTEISDNSHSLIRVEEELTNVTSLTTEVEPELIDQKGEDLNVRILIAHQSGLLNGTFHKLPLEKQYEILSLLFGRSKANVKNALTALNGNANSDKNPLKLLKVVKKTNDLITGRDLGIPLIKNHKDQ